MRTTLNTKKDLHLTWITCHVGKYFWHIQSQKLYMVPEGLLADLADYIKQLKHV